MHGGSLVAAAYRTTPSITICWRNYCKVNSKEAEEAILNETLTSTQIKVLKKEPSDDHVHRNAEWQIMLGEV